MAFTLPRRLVWPLLAALALAAPACHPPKVADPNDPAFVVAQGDGWTITRDALNHEVDDYLKEQHITPAQVPAGDMPVVETAMLKNMVLEKLLLARASTMQFKDLDKVEESALGRLKGRFPTDQAFQDKLKQSGITEDDLKKRIHEQVLIEKLFETEAFHDVDPTDKETNDFYLGHKELFQIPLKLRASRVLVIVDEKSTPAQKAKKKKTIDAARTRVMKGEDFSKVATEVSDDRYSAPRGGDTGYFQRGENESGFDDVAFSSKVGVVSPVFETPMGYQFIKVTEIKPAGLLPIDDVRGAIVENLRKLKIAQQRQDYAKKIMAGAKVTYNIPLTEPSPVTSAPANAGATTSTTVTNPAPAGP